MTTVLPPVALPPPGPALVLHQAAARLRGAAEAAQARQAEDDRPPERWYADLDNALGGPIGILCGLLSPELALELCDWLDATAVEAVRHAAGGWGNLQEEITDGYPTAIARRILEAV
ncbi:hypothetical protein ABZX65_26925 [Streptomyces sp. NPDC003300]|uniref:hypothetical protein n=1 Tax=unclassified Streptomyces TaxID=2593676 RepID=UPI0033B44D92